MENEAIWNRARTDLAIPTEDGDTDPFLWEHAARVTRNAMRIAGLAEVGESEPDMAALEAAALYHDAGWVIAVEEGEIGRMEVLLRQVPAGHFERGAAMLEERASGILAPDSLRRAVEVLRAMETHDAALVEAQVLSDADNLDEFGLLSLWPNIRRGVLEGRGVESLLRTWRRRKEYRFWEARLRDSFHFAAVRVLAERRLALYDRFMEDLANQAESADVRFDMPAVPDNHHADTSS